MKLLIHLIIISIIIGCANGVAPTSLDELLNNRPSTKYCYSDPVNEITLRTRNFFHSCYKDKVANIMVPVGALYMPMTFNNVYVINEEDISNGTRFVVKDPNSGRYIVAAEVSSGSVASCKTQLVAYAGNAGSQTFFPSSIDKFTHGQSSECPFNVTH